MNFNCVPKRNRIPDKIPVFKSEHFASGEGYHTLC